MPGADEAPGIASMLGPGLLAVMATDLAGDATMPASVPEALVRRCRDGLPAAEEGLASRPLALRDPRRAPVARSGGRSVRLGPGPGASGESVSEGALLRRVARELSTPDRRVGWEIVHSVDPAGATLGFARDRGAGSGVATTRAASGVERPSLGSLCMGLVGAGRIPVAVIGPDHTTEPALTAGARPDRHDQVSSDA